MLSVSMIVKNESRFLRGCLDSLKGVADEIVIADTGSEDNTLDIAMEYNAKLYYYKWDNDFSAARNFSLGKCTGDWILYIDADEELSDESVEIVKKITLKKKKEAYYCKIINTDSAGNRPSVMKYPRLFPNDKRLRFTGKVHEQIEPSLVQNNFKISDSGIVIIHKGYNLTKEGLMVKAQRNLTMLQEEYKVNPSSYYAYQIGQTLGILGSTSDAVRYFRESVKDKTLNNEYKSVAFRYIAVHMAEENNYIEALENISLSLKYYRYQPLALLVAARIHLQLKHYDKANELCIEAWKVNAKYLNGRESNFQSIYLDEKTVIKEGMYTALIAENTSSFEYFLNKLSVTDSEYYSRVSLLLNNKNIDDPEKFSGYILEEDLRLFLTLLEQFKNPSLKALYSSLYKRFRNNPEFLVSYGKIMYKLAYYSEAFSYFGESYRLRKDATLIFQMISSLLMLNDFKSAASLICEAEQNYIHDEPFMSRLNIVKAKIMPLLKMA